MSFSGSKNTITRRGLILGAAAGLGGLILPSSVAYATPSSQLPSSMMVPGASLSLPTLRNGLVLQQGVYAPAEIRLLQDALRLNWRAKFLNYRSTGTFAGLTAMALMNWQMAAQYPVTGKVAVGSQQWSQLMWERLTLGVNLQYQTRYVAHFPPLTDYEWLERVACVSLTDLRAYFCYNGVVQFSVPIRVGRPSNPTYPGKFRVSRHVWQDISREFNDAPMPRSVYFNNGIAFHQSDGFAVQGYGSWSHGCVNIASLDDATRVYHWLKPWDLVVVYHGGTQVWNKSSF